MIVVIKSNVFRPIKLKSKAKENQRNKQENGKQKRTKWTDGDYIQVSADEESNFAYDITQAVENFGLNSIFLSSLYIDSRITHVSNERES